MIGSPRREASRHGRTALPRAGDTASCCGSSSARWRSRSARPRTSRLAEGLRRHGADLAGSLLRSVVGVLVDRIGGKRVGLLHLAFLFFPLGLIM
jgi:hypothetical protein